MVLVRYSHSLEHGDFMLIVVSWDSGDVDVGKATFGEVLFYDDPLAADLDLGSRQKGTGRRIGSWRWSTVCCCTAVRKGCHGWVGGGGGLRAGSRVLHGIERWVECRALEKRTGEIGNRYGYYYHVSSSVWPRV
jgi:hypothetical protein